MTALLIRLLGPVEVICDGQSHAGPLGDKSSALLGFLATEGGRPHRRDTLAEMLWPELPAGSARLNLRQLLYRLRRLVDHDDDVRLHVQRETVAFDASACELDTVGFEAAGPCEEPAGGPGCDACLVRLEGLAQRYRGPFMEGVAADFGSEYDEWLQARRRACHGTALALLAHLADCRERRREWRAALEHARRHIALDPWDESGQRRLLRLLADNGNSREAVDHFRYFRELLAREIGTAPEPATAALAEQIRRQTAAAAPVGEDSDPSRIAKITQPQPPPAAVLRPGVFQRLDQAEAYPVTWIAGPPGAGKTTLASLYLQSRSIPCLWFQLDEGDADPASFFHYLGLAARKLAPRAAPLPHLTPEYLPNLALFTRRYMEQLCQALIPPGVLVFDNYQEVAADAALQAVMAMALASLPPGIRAIVLSRAEPPPALARLRAAQQLILLGWEAIRLSPDESAAIAQARNPDLPPALLTRLYARTQGWAAGLVLAMERPPQADTATTPFAAPQAVFDYFAGEIFSDMPAATREVLLHCALLPRITAGQAEAMSGDAHAGDVLADLNARGYFTLRHDEAGYQFHPLFREFLLARAARTYPPEQLRALRCRAAGQLDADGQGAEAIALLVAAEAWDEAAAAVCRHAQALLQQGRAAVVEKWIRALPAEYKARHSWLTYWKGLCRLPFNPIEARDHFTRAYARFQAADDAMGMYLAWAGVMDTFVYAWSDFHPVDHWIAEFEALFQRHPEFASAQVEARAVSGMFNALLWRQPQHPDLPAWAERLSRIVLASDDFSLRIALGTSLVNYYILFDRLAGAALIVDALRPASVRPDSDPLALQAWWVVCAMHSWFVAEHDACLEAVVQGTMLGERTGVRLLEFNLFGQGVYSALSQGDLDLAADLLHRMGSLNTTRLLDRALYHHQSASLAWYRGELHRGLEHADASIRFISDAGSPYPEGLCRAERACILFDMGRHDEAAAELAHAAALTRGLTYMQFQCGITRAWFALERGQPEAALAALREALATGAEQDYVNFSGWRPAIMHQLCGLALAHGIETAYVRRLARRRGLAIPGVE